METSALQRFRENLERQRRSLVEWITGAPESQKQIHLGPFDENAAKSRLNRIDEAIAKAEERTLGVCTVCHEFVEDELLEMDFTACVCIDHFSDAEKRRLEQDLELSHKVQKSLLPKDTPAIPGLRIAAFLQPAEIVGGDYFDFFTFADGAHGIAIADVMGKGLPASMLVAGLQASLRILVPQHNSPDEVIMRLNQLFRNNIHLIRFITIVLVKYDANNRVVEYCNAGHNPPLLHQTSNGHAIHRLTPTGPAIGLTESATFTNARAHLRNNDLLLLYTDGLTEAHNGEREEFGEARLAKLLAASTHLDAKSLLGEIRTSLAAFTGSRGLADDLTIVAAKVV